MKISLEHLLSLVAQEDDRARLRDLSQRYRSARADGVIDDVMQEIHKHWRAVRRPMPTREEVREMLEEE